MQKTALYTFVTQDRKLTCYHGYDFGELYDLEADPGEVRNLWDMRRTPTSAGDSWGASSTIWGSWSVASPAIVMLEKVFQVVRVLLHLMTLDLTIHPLRSIIKPDPGRERVGWR